MNKPLISVSVPADPFALEQAADFYSKLVEYYKDCEDYEDAKEKANVAHITNGPDLDIPAGERRFEVDVRGFPWDSRIHAETKNKNKDQTWRYRRNLPEGTIEAVEAELKSLMAIPTPTGLPKAVPVQVVVAETEVVQVPPAPVVQVPPAPVVQAPPATAPVVEMAPVATPIVQAPPAAAPVVETAPTANNVTNFQALMQKVATNIAAKKITAEQFNAILANYGLTSPIQLSQRTDFISFVEGDVNALLAG